MISWDTSRFHRAKTTTVIFPMLSCGKTNFTGYFLVDIGQQKLEVQGVLLQGWKSPTFSTFWDLSYFFLLWGQIPTFSYFFGILPNLSPKNAVFWEKIFWPHFAWHNFLYINPFYTNCLTFCSQTLIYLVNRV